MGIHALYNTPTWADDLDKICNQLNPPSEDYCDELKEGTNEMGW